MNDKITNYLNGVFAPYDEVKSVAELKSELLADLQERFRDLKAEGMDDETAFKLTIDSIGDIEETVLEVANISRSLERQVLTNFSASDLTKGDFSGVTAHNGKFNASALPGADFSGADLTGSSFIASDLKEAKFDRTNLTDCVLSASDLQGASFNKTILVRTKIDTSDLTKARFTDVKLIDVKLSMTDLRKVVFENCVFNGVDFKYSDLKGLNFDGQTFIGVRFDRADLSEVSFQGAILKNVSFHAAFTLFKRYYRALKTIRFDGAMMDKLTYASLKGMNVDLSKVTII